MEELKKLRYEVLNLRNMNEISTNAETKLLHKLNALEKAINYTRSCDKLKEFDSDNFEDWLIVNGYECFKNFYLKGNKYFSEEELMQKYNNEVMNL